MKHLGMQIEVHLYQDDKQYALGLRSDSFPDREVLRGAILALTNALIHTSFLILEGKPVNKIAHPFYEPAKKDAEA